jgi:hypothetical protein
MGFFYTLAFHVLAISLCIGMALSCLLSLCMKARWNRDYGIWLLVYQLLLNLIYFYFILINSFKTSAFVFIEVLYIIKESIYEFGRKQDLEGFYVKNRVFGYRGPVTQVNKGVLCTTYQVFTVHVCSLYTGRYVMNIFLKTLAA